MPENLKSNLPFDPLNPAEQAAAESLRQRIIYPFSDIKVAHTRQPKPIRADKLAEIVPIAKKVVEGSFINKNSEHNKEERKAV